MRGKLRDKRTATKKDSFKREEDRRRLGKRENRTQSWVTEQEDEDGEYELNDEGQEIEIPQSK